MNANSELTRSYISYVSGLRNLNSPAAGYDVALSAIRIRNTRARRQDTVYFRIRVSVDGVDKGTAAWDGTGGRKNNNGYYDTLRNEDNRPIAVSTGPIADSSLVKIGFIVMKSGAGVWGLVASTITSVLAICLGANCADRVAAHSFLLSGEQIKERMGHTTYYNWTNSNYSVTIQIIRNA